MIKLFAFGPPGTSNEEINFSAVRIACAQDADAHMWISDYYRSRICDCDGKFIRDLGLGLVGGIAFDYAHGEVFLSEPGQHNINVCSFNGDLIRKFGTNGSGDGQMEGPFGIALSADGLLFVAEKHNNRVSVFRRDGSFVRVFGSDGEVVQLEEPTDVAVSHDNRVLIMDLDGWRSGSTNAYTSTYLWSGSMPRPLLSAAPTITRFSLSTHTHFRPLPYNEAIRLNSVPSC